MIVRRESKAENSQAHPLTMPGLDLRIRQPLLGLAACAVAGIVVADRWPLPPGWMTGLAIVLGLAALLRPRTALCWLFTAAAFATLHSVRCQNHPARQLARVLDAGPRVARAAGIVWSEPQPVKFHSGARTGRFRMKVERLEIDGRNFIGGMVNVTWAGPLPAYGDRVRLLGSAENVPPVRNPGEFDSARHLRRQGICSEIEVFFPVDAAVESSGHGELTQRFAIAARHWLAERLGRDLEDEPDIRTLIASMVLGMRASETPEEMQEIFRRTGTLHLFAVSGLNTAMLGLIAVFVLKAAGLSRRAAVFLTVPVLAGYALVTGLSPSCVRAAIMTSLLLLGSVIDRRVLVFNSLGGAAVIILAWDSNQLFTAGFQFSFVLVAVIVWLSTRIARPLEPLGRPDAYLPKPLWSWRQHATAFGGKCLAASLGITLAAWLGSVLFTAGYFHLFSASAILANMLAVPLAFAVLALGLASALSSLVSAAAGVLFNNANFCCAKLLLLVVHGFSELPGGHTFVELPGRESAPACEITVLDVGAGAAIHIRSGEQDWLIDGGPLPLYSRRTLPYLRSRGINRLDALLLTHGDARHIGAASAILDDLAPRRILDVPLRDRSPIRRSFTAELASRGKGRSFLRRGHILRISPAASLRVLFPPTGSQRNIADEKAVVLLLECEGRRVLLTSDAGFSTERWLVEHEPALHADVLVKGWHGQDFSGTADFIAAVKPAAIVCSRPDYGADGGVVRSRQATMAKHGAVLFPQEECGAVIIRIDGGEALVSGFVGGRSLRIPAP